MKIDNYYSLNWRKFVTCDLKNSSYKLPLLFCVSHRLTGLRDDYLNRLFVALLVFGMIIGIFSSCSQEEDFSGNNNDTDDVVTVSFTVGNSSLSVYDATLRSKAQHSVFQTHLQEENQVSENKASVYPIAEGLYMHTTIVENVSPVRLRSMPLNAGTKVRILAYTVTSIDTTLVGQADYEVAGGGTLVSYGTLPLSLSSGAYKFVAYSFNETIDMPAFANPILAITSRDLIWGETDMTVNPANVSVHITMEHLFAQSKLKVEVTHQSNSVINQINGAGILHSFPTLFVHSGELYTGASGLIPVSWPNTGFAQIWESNYHPVYMYGNPPVVVIDNVTIDATPYYGPFTINYSTPLAAGKEYTFYVHFIVCTELSNVSLTSTPTSSGMMFTGETLFLTATPGPSNASSVEYHWQYHDGTTWVTQSTTNSPTHNVTILQGSNQFRVIAFNDCSTVTSNTITITGVTPVGGSSARITWDDISERYVLTTDPRDAGLYFRYGSIVGLFSGQGRYTQDLSAPLNSSTFNAANHVTINVSTVPITSGSNASIIPYVQAQTNIVASFHTPTNVKAGLGDPCRLVGLDLNNIKNKTAGQLTNAEIDNGLWRLPTGIEQQQFSGYPSGSNYTGGMWWWGQGQNLTNFTLGIAGGEFPARNDPSGGPGKFLPAVGDRSSAGQAGRQLTRGVFMTSTSQTGNTFQGFHFDAYSCYLASGYSMDWFWPVRCVPQ